MFLLFVMGVSSLKIVGVSCINAAVVAFVSCGAEFPGILLKLVSVMVLNLADAGSKVPSVAMLMVGGIGSSVSVPDNAVAKSADFLVIDLPAVTGVL